MAFFPRWQTTKLVPTKTARLFPQKRLRAWSASKATTRTTHNRSILTLTQRLAIRLTAKVWPTLFRLSRKCMSTNRAIWNRIVA